MGEAKIFLIPRETNILHPAIRIEVTDSSLKLTISLFLRIKSIWNSRSRAVMKPSILTASRREEADMDGIPKPSDATSIGDSIPWIGTSPLKSGREAYKLYPTVDAIIRRTTAMVIPKPMEMIRILIRLMVSVMIRGGKELTPILWDIDHRITYSLLKSPKKPKRLSVL